MLQSVGRPGATILFVQDCPNEEDLREGRPYSGYDGREFYKMLTEAGINANQCHLTSLIRTRIPGNDALLQLTNNPKNTPDTWTPLHDKWVSKEIQDGLAFLYREIALVAPLVICTTGPVGTWAVTGKWGLKSWRGSEITAIGPIEGRTVVGTYAPGYIRRVWADRQIVVNDFKRVKRLCENVSTEGDVTGGLSQLSPVKYASRAIIAADIATTLSTLDMLLKEIVPSGVALSVDIETRQGHIDCIGIAWSAEDAISIPLTYANAQQSYWGPDEEALILHALYTLLTHPDAIVIGQNFLYDAQYIYRWLHFIPRFVRDTMLAHHVMFPSMQKSLDFQASIYLDNYTYWKKQHDTNEERWIYNAKDCCITWAIDQVQQPAVDQINMREVHDFQQSLFYPVLDTMIEGIRIDLKAKEALAGELFQSIAEHEADLLHMVGHPLNVKSPNQMTEFFYGELGQKPVISRKTGNPTCDNDALEKIAARESLLAPLIQCISELRSLSVYLATFVQAPVDVDHRMRCSFNIAGTKTFRFSSSENAFNSGMNLQNIPKGDED